MLNTRDPVNELDIILALQLLIVLLKGQTSNQLQYRIGYLN